MKAGLLIIDVQNDFGEKGALPIKGSEEILPIINNIRSTYDKKFASVFLTQQYRPPTHIAFTTSPYAKEENLPFDKVTLAAKGKFPPHNIGGTPGANFMTEMLIKGDEILIRKDEDKFTEELSSWTSKLLREIVKTNEINTMFVCGLTYDFSVGLTAIDIANSSKGKIKVYVSKDACKAYAEASEKAMDVNLEKNGCKLITFKEFEDIIKEVADARDATGGIAQENAKVEEAKHLAEKEKTEEKPEEKK
jgi:nicotinamidase/pyrazinamidase